MEELNKSKTSEMPFYFSDMLGYQSSKNTTHIVQNPSTIYYALNTPFDLTTVSNKSVNVYINGVQLVEGLDYKFEADYSGFVTITKTKVIGDVIDIYEYNNTDGSYIPATPTKLGLYPKFVPQKFLDTTYQTPVNVIQGHDGSIFVAYNDFRDDLLPTLDVERGSITPNEGSDKYYFSADDVTTEAKEFILYHISERNGFTESDASQQYCIARYSATVTPHDGELFIQSINVDDLRILSRANSSTNNWTLGDSVYTGQISMASASFSEVVGSSNFIYVVKGQSWVKGTDDYVTNIADCDFSPNYDESAWIYSRLLDDNNGTGKFYVFKNVAWVGAPLLAPGSELNLSNTATIKLRVSKPYKQYETVNPYNDYNSDLVIEDSEIIIKDKNTDLTPGNTYVVAYENAATTWGGKTITYDGFTYLPGESFVASATLNFTGSNRARVIEANSLNSFNPIYRFSTDDIVAVKGDAKVALNAMETIKVVPNPYYGYSSYEINQLDNRVKITNLPGQATIKIFTVSGTLVRTLKKDDSMTSIDWDLKNDFGIPIASGLYVIHIRARFWDADTNKFVEKDKVVKWFGALRPIDLDTF